MKREIKISPVGQKTLDNWNKLFKEESEKQLEDSDKYEIKPISESLKEKAIEIVKLQEFYL